MIKIYIAGAYSASDVLTVLRNIGKGERLSTEVFKAGFAPFSPWLDKDYVILDPDFNYTVQMFYDYSITWLKVSDGVLLVSGWEHSTGTKKEIEIAHELNIPVFDNIEDLKKYFGEKNETNSSDI